MSVRSYPVPRSVVASATRTPPPGGLTDVAVRSAARGRVRRHHLAVLASSRWRAGAEWARSVLEREDEAVSRRRESLLAAIGYDPDTYIYHGVLDPGYPDHELIMSVARQADADSPLERWDGVDWGTAEVGPDGLGYLVLDQDVLADVLEAVNAGSAGVMLRPFEPRAWIQGGEPLDYPILSAAPPPRHTGAMVAFPIDPDTAQHLSLEGGHDPDDLHVTLAYLGDTEEEPIDEQAIHRAVARWVRRVGEMGGEISGPAKFTAMDEPVTVALVDCPDLPEARQLLVRLLESEGVDVKADHGFTPHITLADGERDDQIPNDQLWFDRVGVYYGGAVKHYPMGQPVMAAGGSSPDIYYAIVDEFDTNAVLDVIRILPGPVAYRRSGGKWVKDVAILTKLMGVDPPPVVEIDPDQANDVLAQVDAYDAENPEPDEPMQAAGIWTEELHPRDRGKFAKKQGQGAAPQRPAARRPAAKAAPGRPTDLRKAGRRPTAAQMRQKPWLALQLGNDRNLHDLDMGLGKEFWNRQPAGFHKWLVPFLQKQQRREDPNWKSQVPPRFRKAIDDFGKTAGEKSEHPGQYGKDGKDGKDGKGGAASTREAARKGAEKGAKKAAKKGGGRGRDSGGVSAEDVAGPAVDITPTVDPNAEADSNFDIGFAQEGLGEARRREIFDRQIAGAAERLVRAGIDPDKAARVLRRKIADEKRRRAEFERKRRTAAEQERVRRLKASGVTAAVSMMPAKLKAYWTKGEGAAKIRWGAGGDFNRCVRNLEKYMPGRAKGACANLHKLALGFYPGPSRPH